MPANRRKVLSDTQLTRFNTMYKIEYDRDNNQILVKLTTCKKVTAHKADEQFHINSVRLNQKIVFSMEAINIWKELQDESRYKGYTLFDVNNTINKLYCMYQPLTKENVLYLLKTNFNGIRRV